MCTQHGHFQVQIKSIRSKICSRKLKARTFKHVSPAGSKPHRCASGSHLSNCKYQSVLTTSYKRNTRMSFQTFLESLLKIKTMRSRVEAMNASILRSRILTSRFMKRLSSCSCLRSRRLLENQRESN